MSETGKTNEDYLEAILMCRKERGYARSVDVAAKLGVTKPSVTYSTKRLKESGYITTDEAGMLLLTEAGAKIAENICFRHEMLTNFFESLGVSREQARIDACKVEHDVSDATFAALCRHAGVEMPAD